MGGCTSKPGQHAISPIAKGMGALGSGRLAFEIGGHDKQKDVKAVYTFEKVVDKGSQGTIWQVRHKASGQVAACKVLAKSRLQESGELEAVRQEIQILRHLSGHPHIVEVRDVYEDRKELFIVMEMCSGGELFQRISARRRFSEATCARIAAVVGSMLAHCHQMNVMHRDIKPENFLIHTGSGDPWELKAIDFGAGTFFREGEPLTEVVGSPHYVAPEVLRGSYGPSADVWSAGVMLYILLSGRPPFDGDKDEQIFRRILSSPLDLKSGAWASLSDGAKDLVRRMLARSPKRRIAPENIASHPWVMTHLTSSRRAITTSCPGDESGVQPEDGAPDAGEGLPGAQGQVPELLQRMRAFSQMNELRREALKICARLVPESELFGMREMFNAIDKDRSGSVTLTELVQGLRRKGARHMSLADAQALMAEMDMGGDQKLQYEEFIAATLPPVVVQRSEILRGAFKVLDRDGCGYVTREDIQSILVEGGYLGSPPSTGQEPGVGHVNTSLPADLSSGQTAVRVPSGAHLSDDMYTALIQGVDADSDGRLSFEEFCDMMTSKERGMGGLVHRRHASCLQQEAASAAAGAQEAEDVGTTHVPVISGPGAELDVAGSAVALEDGGDGPEARHSDSGSRGAWLGQLEGKQREMRRQESPRSALAAQLSMSDRSSAAERSSLGDRSSTGSARLVGAEGVRPSFNGRTLAAVPEITPA